MYIPVSLRGDIHVQMVRVFRPSPAAAGLRDDDIVSLVTVAGVVLLSVSHPEADGDVRLGAMLEEGGSAVAAAAAVPQLGH